MLHLNQECSYKTLCATPAATCPHVSRVILQWGVSGDTKMGHLSLKRLSTISRSWDMLLCGSVQRETHSIPREGVTGWMQLKHNKANPGSASGHGHHHQEGPTQTQAEARPTDG